MVHAAAAHNYDSLTSNSVSGALLKEVLKERVGALMHELENISHYKLSDHKPFLMYQYLAVAAAVDGVAVDPADPAYNKLKASAFTLNQRNKLAAKYKEALEGMLANVGTADDAALRTKLRALLQADKHFGSGTGASTDAGVVAVEIEDLKKLLEQRLKKEQTFLRKRAKLSTDSPASMCAEMLARLQGEKASARALAATASSEAGLDAAALDGLRRLLKFKFEQKAGAVEVSQMGDITTLKSTISNLISLDLAHLSTLSDVDTIVKMKDLVTAEIYETDTIGEDQIKLLRAKLKAKLKAKLGEAKIGAKQGVASAINSMAAGATPEEVLNQMFEQLAKQLFDFEEFKASFEKMVNDKIAELHEQAVGGVAEQIEKIQAAKENVMQMYADLEAVTKKIGKAFAALFDMTAALKPSDELLAMFGGDKAMDFDEENMGGLDGAAEMGKKFEGLLKEATGGMVGRLETV